MRQCGKSCRLIKINRMIIKLFDQSEALVYLESTLKKNVYVIQITDPGSSGDFPKSIPFENRLHLSFIDTFDSDSAEGPNEELVRKLLLFAENIPNSADEIVVYCRLGFSRSPAIVFILLCHKLGYGNETEALRQTLKLKYRILPNFLLVKLADKILLRAGNMTRLLSDYYSQHTHFKHLT